jgi:hypothetical protein
MFLLIEKEGKREGVETKRKDETRSTVTLDTYDTITSMPGSNRLGNYTQ